MAQESRLSITIDTRSAEQGVRDLESALAAMDAAGIRIRQTSRAAGSSLEGMGGAATKGASGVDGLTRSLKQTEQQAAATQATINRVLKTALAGFSAMQLIDAADNWGQYASRMRMATETADEYNHAQQRMAQSAQLTFRAINETREAFIQLSPVLREMGLSLDQSIDAVDAFSGLLVVNGANAERGAAAMEALAKSFQRGRVDAQAWMTIYSTADTIVGHLAESSGKTAAEIRQLGVEGKISADMMAKALVSAYEPVIKQVEGMPTTVRDALTNLNTAFGEYIGKANESSQVTATLASGIGFVSGNFETFADVLGYVATGAIALYTSRTIGATAASAQAIAASYLKARASLAEAKTEAQAATAALASARANLGLTTTHAQVTAAKLAEEAATKRLAVAQAALPRAGAALLGVLGGPAGLVATIGLSVASMLAFRYESSKTELGVNSLTQEIDALNTSTKELTQNQARQAMLELKKPLEEAEERVRLLEDNIEGLSLEMKRIPAGTPLFAEFQDALVRAKGDLDSTKTTVGRLIERMRDLQSAASGAGAAVATGAGDLSSEYLRIEEQIKRQIALMGKSGQAAQYRYDLEHGALAKLHPLEKKKMEAWVNDLEASERAEEARRKAAAGAAKMDKEAARLINTLRDQVAVLGMSESEMFKYQLRMAGAAETELKAAEALLQKKKAYEDTERANKLYNESLREQRSIAEEIAIFQSQKDLEITGRGLGERRRQQLAEEYQIQEDYARRRRELEERQRVESTRMDEQMFLQSIENLRAAEEQKLAISRRSAEERLLVEQNWITGMQEALANYRDHAQNISAQTEQFFTNSFGHIEQGLFDLAKTGELNLTKILSSVGDEALRVLIKIGTQAMINAAIGQAAGAATTAASVAQGAAAATAWAPAAAFASLASFGANAAPAAAGITSTVGLAQALSLTGMAHSGIDQVPREGTWLLDKGERVLSPRQNSDLTSYLKKANTVPASTGGGGQPIQINVEVNIANDGTAQTQVDGAGAQQGRKLAEMVAGMVQQGLVREMRQGGLLWNRQNGYSR